MSLLRIDTSLRVDGSATRRIADIIEAAWSHDTTEPVVRRDLAREPLSSRLLGTISGAAATPEGERTSVQKEALATSLALTEELFAAQAVVVASPLYNYGVSQHLKTWIDAVFTDPRLGPASVRPLAGRKAVVVVARGGSYAPGTPREGWDHGAPWVARVLGDAFGMDVEVLEVEFTMAAVNPALAQFVPLGEASLAKAEARAAELGAEFAKHAALVS